MFGILLASAFAFTDPMLTRGLDTITAAEIKESTTYLASPELNGRRTGSAGEILAEKFVAQKFESFGVKPMGTNGYFQPWSKGTANVVGVVYGQDPVLKEEYVVIGAHLDHLGGSRGYYPGADDNASGTAGLIELAEAMTRVDLLLRRSVIFVAFSGEEQGMNGSSYFVSNSPVPTSKIVYMVNLDMVGRVKNGSVSCLGSGASTMVSNLIKEIAPRYNLKASISSSSGGGSDHVPFTRKNIGVTFFHTGTHSDYHRTSDTPDKINYDGLEGLSKMAFEVVYNLSISPTKPKFDRPLEVDSVATGLDHGLAPFQK